MNEMLGMFGWVLFGAIELVVLVTAFRGRRYMLNWERAERAADIKFFTKTKKV